MNSKRPIFWHQGLFLQPQHFQYSDAHQEWAANALARRVHSYRWGVVDLALNEERLAGGVIAIDRCTLLFRDGTLVQTPDNALLAARDFRANWDGERGPLTVYIGLKRTAIADGNVTTVVDREAGQRAPTRYASIADSDPLPDLHQGGDGTAQVKTLHYVLRLFWDSEVSDAEDYELIPVARLLREGDAVEADPHYAPPALTVAAAPSLLRLLREIRDDVVGRAHQLEEYKGPSDGAGEFSPKVFRYRLALQVVGRYAPRLAHIVDAPQVHPCDVYGTLRELAGELSGFAADVDVMGTVAGQTAGLPAYDHREAGRCYRDARLLIEKLLNAITVGPELMVALERTEERRYLAELPRPFLDRRVSLYLVLRTETSFDQLLDSFRQFAKLGAAGEVETYVQRALPGLQATYLQVRPEALPHRPKTSYFRLEQNDSRWDEVENQRTLALLWDEAPEDLKVELVMVRR